MRQVFLDKGTIVVKEVCHPLLDDYSVIVSVHYSYISSGLEIAAIMDARENIQLSDIPKKIERVLASISAHGIHGAKSPVKGKLKDELRVLGYSCSGHVVAVGKKVKSFRTGDLVACAGSGFANHADVVCVPEHLVVHVHKKEMLKAASVATLGAIALNGIRRANVQLGERVCVFGLGFLGQLTVQLAKAAGCFVIGIDLLDDRVALAQKFGADAVYNAATQPDLIKEIVFATGQYGVDATIITARAKDDAVIQQAMHMTRKKGKIVIVGDVGLHLDRTPLLHKELDILASHSYGPGRYDHDYEQKGHDYPYAYVRWTENRNMRAFVELLEKGSLVIDPLLESEVSLEHIARGYEKIINDKKLGVVVRYENPEAFDLESLAKTEQACVGGTCFRPAVKDAMSVGIVGGRGFVTSLLPSIVSRMPGVKINAVVDKDIARSLSISRLYGSAPKALVDDQDLFRQNLVDVVVVDSAHKFHGEHALRALRNGKAVFMEKPMVTSFEQLEQFKEFLQQNPKAPLCVNYHRSFAPCIDKIKQAVKKRTSPLIVNYRVNAELPIYNDENPVRESDAGRVIGEACHLIDLFCFLTDSKPASVSVDSLHSARNLLFPTDNFTVQLSFEDGSLCSLVYTSLGNPRLGRERMEIFYDSKSIIMHDYMRVTGYGLPSSFNIWNKIADNGHEELFTTFFKRIKDPAYVAPIDMNRLLLVAELTLIIDRLACQGGGSNKMG